jgi:frataxin
MQENEFHPLADGMLTHLLDAIEAADADGELEVDLTQGVLSIDLPDGKQFLVSKHAPSMQLWLSSFLSGGLHFSYDAASGHWLLKDGRSLPSVLAADIAQATGMEIYL